MDNNEHRENLIKHLEDLFGDTGAADYVAALGDAIIDERVNVLGAITKVPIISIFPVVARILYRAKELGDIKALSDLLNEHTFFSDAKPGTKRRIVNSFEKANKNQDWNKIINNALDMLSDQFKEDKKARLQVALLKEYIYTDNLGPAELYTWLEDINSFQKGDFDFLVNREFPDSVVDSGEGGQRENIQAFAERLMSGKFIEADVVNGKIRILDAETEKTQKLKQIVRRWDSSIIPEKRKRNKKTIDELLEHLEKEKGVKFEEYSKPNAREYLETQGFYYHVIAYKLNYRSNDTTNSKTRYPGLDFKYLIELAEIDGIIRDQVLSMTLEIEQRIKAQLNSHILSNPNENATDIVSIFFGKAPSIKEQIRTRISGTYSGKLAKKYVYGDCPFWVLLELLSFNQLITFVRFYEDRCRDYGIDNPFSLGLSVEILYYVRKLRDAAAHNNCLIKDLRTPPKEKGKNKVFEFVREDLRMSENHSVHTNNRFIHDFVCLFITYYRIMGKKEIENCNKKWKEINNTNIEPYWADLKQNSTLFGACEALDVFLRSMSQYCEPDQKPVYVDMLNKRLKNQTFI